MDIYLLLLTEYMLFNTSNVMNCGLRMLSNYYLLDFMAG